MKFFTKQETKVVIIILLVISIFSFFNFRLALRRARDNERKNDLGDITKLLDDYKNKNSLYPASLSLLKNAPKDPGTPSGYSYQYYTDGKFFQIYASLEGPDEPELDPKVIGRNIKCGNFICNFGKTSGTDVPLDKSLEEYENELYVRDLLRKKQAK